MVEGAGERIGKPLPNPLQRRGSINAEDGVIFLMPRLVFMVCCFVWGLGFGVGPQRHEGTKCHKVLFFSDVTDCSFWGNLLNKLNLLNLLNKSPELEY